MYHSFRDFPYCAFVCFLISACAPEQQPPAAADGAPAQKNILPVNTESIVAGADTLAIVHCRIITGDGQTVIPDGAVLITGDRIASAGNFADTPLPDGIETLDASGSTLLPGLIDAHFHLDRMDSLPSLFLERGITSLRDPGAWIEAYTGEMAANRTLPRLYLTGPHIDMYPPAYPDDAFVVRDVAEAEAAVRASAAQGASAIKVYFRCSQEIIRAVCGTAQGLGLPVTAHLEITDMYEAVAAGINGIEHITSLGYSLTPRRQAERYKQALLKDNNARRNGRYEMWRTINPAGDSAGQLAHFLAERGVFLCPTLGAFEYQAEESGADSLRLTGFRHMLEYTRRLHEEGVAIVVGSHSWVPYAEYGWAYHHELELLQQLGMKPLEILRAATLQNARFFRIEDQVGSIEKGKLADLLLVAGDPSKDISAMRKVQGVMLAGRWVKAIER